MREPLPISPSRSSTHPLTRAHALVEQSLGQVESALEDVNRSTVEMIPEISHHLIGAGGKRIRPTLLLLMASTAGPDSFRGVDLATAAELIHSATLLHDDVVDRGHLRRGVAAAPQVYGNSASVLVGDFMMARAFSLVAGHGNLDLIRALSRVVSAMAEGEMLQLVRSGRITLSLPNYEEIIAGKTAGLFSWACEAGASLAGHAAPATGEAAEFGRLFGMAFQIADDVLDYTSSPAQSGKDLANDLQQGKMTLPLLLACEEDPDLLRVVEEVSARGPTDQECVMIVHRVLGTGAVRRALERAWSFVHASHTRLDGLAGGEAGACLSDLATYVVERVEL